jgi:hypothetical protein
MPRSRVPTNCMKIHSFQSNSEWEQAKRPNPSKKEEEEDSSLL